MASRETALILAAGLACGLLSGPITTARADIINACVLPSGQVRIVGSAGGCRGTETSLSWNTQGPPGSQGPQGATGPQGPEGPQGAPGSRMDTVLSSIPVSNASWSGTVF